MGAFFWFIFVLVVIAAIIAIVYLYNNLHSMEHFINVTNTNEEEIIRAYNSLLYRDPSSRELKTAIYDIKAKRTTMYKIQMDLINSDEYQRYVKTQTNSTSPDLIRVIAEDKYLMKVKQIYMSVFNRKINHNLVLPYNDIYLYIFKKNDTKLRSMFKNKRYPKFEKDVLEDVKLNLDRDKLFTLYEKSFHEKAPARQAGEPQPMYLVKENTLASDAGMWISDDKDIGTKVETPWRSTTQEEVTYKSFVPEGTQFVFGQPVSLTEPIMPPFKTKQPVVVGNRPVPKPPLQDKLVGISLSINPLTLPLANYLMPLDALKI